MLEQFMGDVPLMPHQDYWATSPPLAISDATFVLSAKPSEAVWNRYGPLELYSGQRSSLTLYGAFVERSSPLGKDSPLHIGFTAAQSALIISSAKFHSEIKKATFTSKNRTTPQQSVPQILHPMIAANPEQGAFIVTYPFPRPAPHTWDVYRITMRPGRANLQSPAWVDQWSTNDDSHQSYSNRTLNLQLLVDLMVKGITENVVLLDQFVLLGRGSP
jgi:hypothetical protein